MGIQELLAEDFPVRVVAGLFDHNLLKVVGQLEDDVLVLLVELEVVPGSDALLGDGCSVSRKLSSLVLRSFLCDYFLIVVTLVARGGVGRRKETDPDCDCKDDRLVTLFDYNQPGRFDSLPLWR